MKIYPLLISATLAFAPLATADVLEISVSKQAGEMQGVERPVNGMSKEDVENRFGPPQEMSDPVGEPPISKWTYADYVVYFEYSTVIHTVFKHQPKVAE